MSEQEPIRNAVNKSSEIVPIAETMIVPPTQSLQGQYRTTPRKYIKCKQISYWASEFWKKYKRGFSYRDVLAAGLANKKHEARRRIKYACQTRLLFTVYDKKPQVYYPSALRAEIAVHFKEAKKLQKEEWVKKNAPVRVTGVNDPVESKLDMQDEANANFFLEALKILPNYPLCIHKIQLKLFIDNEHFEFTESHEKIDRHFIIDKTKVNYIIYPNRTVMVFIKCTDAPFKLQSEQDQIELFMFLGQVRERLAMLIGNMHSYIPPLMEWLLTACDINRDMEITDMMQIMGIPALQLKVASRVFRVYAKSYDALAVFRGEESLSFKNASAIKTLMEISNPHGEFLHRLEERLIEFREEIAQMISKYDKANGH